MNEGANALPPAIRHRRRRFKDDPRRSVARWHGDRRRRRHRARSSATTPERSEFDPKTVLAGIIKADGKVKDKIAAGDVIFVVARRVTKRARRAPGTPLAVHES